jgi:ribonuclease-3
MPQKSDSHEARILEDCQAAIEYRFRQPALLRTALTHSSAVALSGGESNERLEFLGDAILGQVISEHLFVRFPSYQPGDLTTFRAAVVDCQACARISNRLKLSDYLFTGNGFKFDPAVHTKLLADLFESLVAAIHLDGGSDAAKTFILKYVNPEIEQEVEKRQAIRAQYAEKLQALPERTQAFLAKLQAIRAGRTSPS